MPLFKHDPDFIFHYSKIQPEDLSRDAATGVGSGVCRGCDTLQLFMYGY